RRGGRPRDRLEGRGGSVGPRSAGTRGPRPRGPGAHRHLLEGHPLMASEQRQEEVRTRLLDAIEGVTDGGEGLGDVSVEKLAKAAGISRATFYIYFADNGDLLSP